MSTDTQNAIIQILQKRLDALVSDFEAVNNDISQKLSEADKNPLRRQSTQLLQEIDEVQQQINHVKSSAGNNSPYLPIHECLKEWEDNFHNINYEKAIQIIKYILDKFSEQYLAVFLLLPNSNSMGAEWCIKKIKISLGNQWNTIPTIRFLPHQPPTEIEFLKKIAKQLDPQYFQKYLNNNPQLNSTNFCDEIIDSLCKNIKNDKDIFIEVYFESNQINKTFLDWLINQFWNSLITKISQYTREKIVMAVAVNISISHDFLSSNMYCEQDNFKSEKIIKLPLSKLSVQDIENWLFNFSGYRKLGLTDQEVKETAYSIYQMSKGEPRYVYWSMLERLKNIYNDKLGKSNDESN